MTAQVTSIETAHSWTKFGKFTRYSLEAHSIDVRAYTNLYLYLFSGLMARESLDSKAKHAFVLMAPNQGTMMHTRKLTGDKTYNSRRFRGKPQSMWLRLKREGDVFTGYQSVVGGEAEHPEWHEIYQFDSSHMVMNNTLEIGMAVTSHQWRKYAEAEFDHFSIDQDTNATGTGRRGLRGTGL
jgi:hypothetical protein